MKAKAKLKKVLKVIKRYCSNCVAMFNDSPCKNDDCDFYPYRKGKFPKDVALKDIKCDRCGLPAKFETDGGHCEECGDDLCADCALWRIDEEERIKCKKCSDKNDGALIKNHADKF